MAQSVKHPTSAQVMTSRSVGSSPAPGSVRTAQSLEPASDPVPPSFSAPPPRSPSVCRSLSKMNKRLKKVKSRTGIPARWNLHYLSISPLPGGLVNAIFSFLAPTGKCATEGLQ